MAWKTARLEEVAQVMGGGTPSRTEKAYFGGGIAWATPTDITALDQLYISKTKETITEAGLQISSTKLMPAGAVLLTSRATIGFTAVSQVPICTNQGFINFICGHELVPEYLAYWLRTQKAKMIKHAGGTTFKEIGRGTIKKFEIPVPPLPEQHRIADLLTRADGIMRLRREAEKKAAELIPTLFLDMFGDPATNPKRWPMAPVGEVIAAADYGSSTKSSDDGSGLPLIRMGNVDYAGTLNLSDLKHVNLSAEEIEKYRLHEGDILFNRTNSKELVGKTGLWDDGRDAIAASYFIRVRVQRDKLNPRYFWAFMNSRHMKRVLFETSRGAIGQANINSKELKAFKVALPPLALQQDFAGKVEQVRSIQSQQTAAATKAQATFDALLAQVFNTQRSQ